MHGPLGVPWIYIHALSHRCCFYEGELKSIHSITMLSYCFEQPFEFTQVHKKLVVLDILMLLYWTTDPV